MNGWKTSQDSLLVTLVKLVERLPRPLSTQKRGRGHPRVYSDRLFLKASLRDMDRFPLKAYARHNVSR